MEFFRDDYYGQTNVPTGLNGVTAIAAGGAHTLALTLDGTVIAWGNNLDGQTSVPTGSTGVTAIAAGNKHTVALKQDGAVIAWGYNGFGQTAIPPGLSGVTAIAAGYDHTVALKQDGTVVALGKNNYGQTNVPAGMSGVTAIAAGGGDYSVAVGKFPNTSITGASFVLRGAAFALRADTIGDGPLVYLWKRDGLPIAGATNSSLIVTNGESGLATVTYTVVVTNPYGQASASKAIAVVLAIRRVPNYWPEQPLEVEIEYMPTPGVVSHTVVEQIPTTFAAGMSVVTTSPSGAKIGWQMSGQNFQLQATNISDLGTFNNGAIRWLFFDDTPRVLRYTLVPRAGWTNDIILSGTLAEDSLVGGTTVVSLGTNTSSMATLHPADSLPATNNFIIFEEMLNYAAAWKAFQLWPVPPFNDPAGTYVNRAALIWRTGEYYVDIGGTAPGRWQPAPRPAGVVPASVASAPASTAPRRSSQSRIVATSLPIGTATRSLSSTTIDPVAPFDVTISLPTTTSALVLVEEQLPAGWTAQNINNGGNLDTNNSKVKWVFLGAAPASVAYRVVPAAGAAGFYIIDGRTGYGDGSIFALGGPNQVMLGTVVTPPQITAQPTNQTVVAGSNATFSVSATGPSLSYFWRKDGGLLSTATSLSLTVSNVTRAASGLYSVIVTNSSGSVTSAPALLRVLVPQRVSDGTARRLGDGRFQFRFLDQDGALASDLTRFEVHYATNFTGTNIAWITNAGGLLFSNGMIHFEDAGSTNVLRRFYRVIER